MNNPFNPILDLFDLRHDQADPDMIDEAIRTNVKVAGTNLWVLIFAILVASVGLNVNSTAVIIGAMLISPLMGPIVGIGYGLGTNDIDLIRLAARNLGIFTIISVLASTLYFVISPLDTAQPELLSRTSPTLWDVLIAFFGGAAGIIATTRKSMSNVIPGVAIATALMPPLCTAGYGLAQGNWAYFGGAFFLYTINSVFIALATLLFVNIFHIPKRRYVDKKTEKRTQFFIWLTVILMIIPSAYLAYNLVQQSKFTQAVNQFISGSYRDSTYVLMGHEVHPQAQEVLLTVGGTQDPEALKTKFESQLKSLGFDKAHVIIQYSGSGEIDMGSLKTQLTQDLYSNMVKQVEELNKQNEQLKSQLISTNKIEVDDQRLFAELTAQYPLVKSISISRGERFSLVQATVNTNNNDAQAVDDAGMVDTDDNTSQIPDNIRASNKSTANSDIANASSDVTPLVNNIFNTVFQPLTIVMIESKEPLEETDKQRIIDWLNVKYRSQLVEVRFEVLY